MPARLVQVVMDAANPDLSAFRKRGGRLILKVNTTDYTVNPRWVMDYYDKVRQTMGASAVDELGAMDESVI